ncbi:MAG TPA: C40 family peptidase [Hymenobacter sp.]
MRFIWLVFVGLAAAMALILPRLNRPAGPSQPAAAALAPPVAAPARPVVAGAGSETPMPVAATGRADSLVAFGLAQRGTPYRYAGTSPLTGFDCSGFIMYTFARFGVAVPHSTALLIDVGRPVPRAAAQPGDIVVFTGTATTSTTPGHAGIVVSGQGEVPLRFVHASSARREPGVKVSQVEGTDYERRFMQVRRVLE